MTKEVSQRVNDLMDRYGRERARLRRQITCFYLLHYGLTVVAIVGSLLALYFATDTRSKVLALSVALAVSIMTLAKPKEYWQTFRLTHRRIKKVLSHARALTVAGAPTAQIANTLYREAESALDDEERMKAEFDRSRIGPVDLGEDAAGGNPADDRRDPAEPN